ncbi:hypothetical protein J4H86_09880 [Spiractinospora alimapuensis]|uniref:ECF transporter S component n=1 Tax=Spiractinospora alimapuensis TaxID=2820884 RepID=UPI001F17BED0|nr:ECF transporter S component [Spiractinospora alimapuensis]QVQ53980.1 hypothetical protein J4H86_09880 [Spiractinospora alimapuensis]
MVTHTPEETPARVGSPAGRAVVGATLAVVVAWVAIGLNNLAHGLEQLGDSTQSISFPHVGVFTLPAWGLTCLAIWLYSRLLRALGEPRPLVVAAVLVLGCVVLFLPVSSLWHPQVGSFDTLAFVVGTATLTFLVLWWRLTGTRLLWRAPLAVVGSFGLVLAIALGQAFVELRELERATAADIDALTLGVYDEDWEIEQVNILNRVGGPAPRDHAGQGGGVRVTYRVPDTGWEVRLSSHPDDRREYYLSCDCTEEGDLLVRTTDRAADPTNAFVEIDGAMYELDLRYATDDAADLETVDIDLAELAERIRPATAEEEQVVQRQMLEHMLSYWRFPPLSTVLDRV